MIARTRQRPRIGDVVRITSGNVAAHAQFTHKRDGFGALLRVFDRSEGEREPTVEEIAQRRVLFSAFFPLGAACQRGIATIVGAAPIRAELEAFPLFRWNRGLRLPGFPENWWLWDGHREWRVGTLSPEHRGLPQLLIINDTLLVERALAGWTDRDVE